jgi:transposase
LLALSQGRSVTQIAQILGVTRQSVYNWIASYGRPEPGNTFTDAPRSGRPTVWTQELQAHLQTALQQPPPSTGRRASRWSVPQLRHYLCRATGRDLSGETVRRKLRELGFHTANIDRLPAGEFSKAQGVPAGPGAADAAGVAPPCQKTFVAE